MIRSFVFLAVAAIAATATGQHAFVLEQGNGRVVGIVFNSDNTISIFTSMTVHIISSNPYPTPSVAHQKLVEPLAKFQLTQADGQAFARVYATATSSRVEQLPQVLADLGKPLNLQGKYPDLADAIEQILISTIGDTSRDTTPNDIAVLRAIAWALYR